MNNTNGNQAHDDTVARILSLKIFNYNVYRCTLCIQQDPAKMFRTKKRLIELDASAEYTKHLHLRAILARIGQCTDFRRTELMCSGGKMNSSMIPSPKHDYPGCFNFMVTLVAFLVVLSGVAALSLVDSGEIVQA